jgi:hypothetical protein
MADQELFTWQPTYAELREVMAQRRDNHGRRTHREVQQSRMALRWPLLPGYDQLTEEERAGADLFIGYDPTAKPASLHPLAWEAWLRDEHSYANHQPGQLETERGYDIYGRAVQR